MKVLKNVLKSANNYIVCLQLYCRVLSISVITPAIIQPTITLRIYQELKNIKIHKNASRLDYCNAAFIHLSKKLNRHLQLIYRKVDHLTPVLHWLPVSQRM